MHALSHGRHRPHRITADHAPQSLHVLLLVREKLQLPMSEAEVTNL